MIDWEGKIRNTPFILASLAAGQKTTAEIAAEMSACAKYRISQYVISGSIRHLIRSGRVAVVGTANARRGGVCYVYALADPALVPFEIPAVERPAPVTTDDDLKRARSLHNSGESWDAIAKSYGITRNCLIGRIEKMEQGRSVPKKPSDTRTHFFCVVEPHKTREIRRINKPDAEIAALAREFAAGNISRAEFVLSIRADR